MKQNLTIEQWLTLHLGKKRARTMVASISRDLTSRGLPIVKKVIPNAHFERVRCFIQEIVFYCKKNTDFKEFGISMY